MVQGIAAVLLILGVCVIIANILQRLSDASERRRERVARRRYLRKFREGQKSCDEMFTEQERAAQKRKKWDKQNVICKDPYLMEFWR